MRSYFKVWQYPNPNGPLYGNLWSSHQPFVAGELLTSMGMKNKELNLLWLNQMSNLGNLTVTVPNPYFPVGQVVNPYVFETGLFAVFDAQAWKDHPKN